VNAVVCDDLVELTASRLRAARAVAVEPANDAGYLLRAGLFPEQLAALDDGARVKALLCGRRAGKTHVLAAMLIDAVRLSPGALALYLTITRRNAKQIIWRILKRMANEAGLAYVANETDLLLDIGGGGTIMLGGADDTAEIEKRRGFAYDLVIVDECGSFPLELLRQLRDDVIEPATADHQGDQVYSGTPGKVLEGPWYEMTRPDSKRSRNVSLHTWTAADNTAVANLWASVLEIKRDRGYGDDHPTWLAEYLGRWVADESILVYPYDDARNGIDGLPTHTVTGIHLAPSGWRYVLGVDVGFVHATAFALGCCHEDDPRDFVVRTEKHKGMLPDQVIDHIRTHYLAQTPWLSIVVDAGGMGKIHERTMSLRGSMGVKAADKREKPDAVRDLRGRLLSGQTKILRGAQNDAIRGEYAMLGWDDKHEAHNKQQDDDCADAVLYMIRELQNFREFADDIPKPPTPAEVAAKIKREHLQRYAPKVDPWTTSDW
jgi:hypothetical protein